MSTNENGAPKRETRKDAVLVTVMLCAFVVAIIGMFWYSSAESAALLEENSPQLCEKLMLGNANRTSVMAVGERSTDTVVLVVKGESTNSGGTACIQLRDRDGSPLQAEGFEGSLEEVTCEQLDQGAVMYTIRETYTDKLYAVTLSRANGSTAVGICELLE